MKLNTKVTRVIKELLNYAYFKSYPCAALVQDGHVSVTDGHNIVVLHKDVCREKPGWYTPSVKGAGELELIPSKLPWNVTAALDPKIKVCNYKVHNFPQVLEILSGISINVKKFSVLPPWRILRLMEQSDTMNLYVPERYVNPRTKKEPGYGISLIMEDLTIFWMPSMYYDNDKSVQTVIEKFKLTEELRTYARGR